MIKEEDQSDLTIKLWNIGSSVVEPISTINTSLNKHKYMV